MKNITIPHTNSTLVTFNKGGSTLFTHTLKLFLNWKGVPIYDGLGKGKIVIITRNPIDRFYSGFLHLTNWKRGVDGLEYMAWEKDKRNEVTLIETLNQYVDDFESGKIEEEGDFHYMRQSKVLKEINVEEYKQHQIEFLHPQIEEVGIWHQPSSNPDFETTQSLIDNQKVMRELPIFDDLGIGLSGWDGHFFCSTYHLTLRNLRGHHRLDSKRMRMMVEMQYQHLGKRIRDILEEDMIQFGYKEPHII